MQKLSTNKANIKISSNKTFIRNLLFSFLFSTLFSFCYYIGFKLDLYKNLFYKELHISRLLICFAITFVAYFLIISNLKKIKKFITNIKVPRKIDILFFEPNAKSYFACFFLICICNSFCLMAHYPGIVTYDFSYQVAFVDLNKQIEVHPLLHNYIMYAIYFLSTKLNSANIGILTHSLFQSAIMISIFSYCIHFLSKHNTVTIIKLWALIYFATYPIHQILMITTTKDVIFSGLILLLSIEILELCLNKKTYFKNKLRCTGLILIILLILCFRLNAISAYILSSPVILLFFKKELKKALIIFISPLILFSIFGEIKKIYGIKKGPTASYLSVPLQQMGRVRLKYDNKLEKKDTILFREIITKDCELKYNIYSVDPMKIGSKDYENLIQINTQFENSYKTKTKDFWQLYFKWLKKYPKDYINAFLLTNYTHWYPFAKYTKIYNFLHGEPSCLFVVNKTNYTKYKNLIIPDKSLNPPFRLYYNLLFRYNNFERNDFLFLIFSYAWNLWFLILNFFLLLNQKKYKYLILFIFPFLLVFSVLFGPTSLLRYVYYNYLILPIAIAFNFSNFKRNYLTKRKF